MTYIGTDLHLYHVVNDHNLDIFNQFRARLDQSIQLADNDLLVAAMIVVYQNKTLYRAACSIILIHHGQASGTIRIVDPEKEFMNENQFLSNRANKYLLGRSGRELVVESPESERRGIFRIDIEERSDGAQLLARKN